MSADPSNSKALDRDLVELARIAMIIACGLGLAYIVWFGAVLRSDPSSDPASWGQFGDYFGGMLNPLISLIALVLLAKGVQLQHRTLVAAQAEMHAMGDLGRRQQLDSNFATLVNVVMQVRHQPTAHELYKVLVDQFLAKRDMPGHSTAAFMGNINGKLPLLRPYFGTLLAAAHLLNRSGSILDPDDLERYKGVLRSFVSTEEASIMRIMLARNILTSNDELQIEQSDLFKHADQAAVTNDLRSFSEYMKDRARLYQESWG